MLKTPPSSVSIEPGPILLLPKDDFLRLDDRQRRRAFTVSGVAEVDALGEIFDLVMEAADEGISWFLDRLPKLYRRRGLLPTIEAHARRVYDTTLRQIRAELTFRQLVGNPTGSRLIPYLKWTAVPGTECTAEPQNPHALMDGRVFSLQHPVWRTWWHPAGHDCTCRVSPISTPQARRMDLAGPEPTGPWPTDPRTDAPVLPDVGFRSAPLPWDPREWRG